MSSILTSSITDPTGCITGLNNGDKSCLEQLFRAYYRNLCFYVAAILEDAATAEEIADDAFLKLSKEALRRPFASVEGVWAFLRVVARNKATDHLRKNNRTRKSHKGYLSFVSTEQAVGPAPTEDLELVWTDVVAQLYAAMNDLPVQQREVMRLNQQGFSTTEIAEIMKLTPQTVRNYRGKAIEVLKGRLSDIAFALIISHPLHGHLL